MLPCWCRESSGFKSALARAALAAAVVAVGALSVASCGGEDAAEQAARTTTTVAKAKWDLVAIGDSTPGAYGILPDEAYTRVYASMLADELGITVTVRDHATWEERTLADWYDVVGTDESLRHDLARAEIITLFVGGHDIAGAVMGGCTGSWPKPLEECFRASTASMPRDFDRLLGAIRDVVPERAKILIGYDGGLPPAVTEVWSAKPYWPEMRQILVDGWRPGLQAAAKTHDATIIPFNDATSDDNGENLHPEFIQGDGIHFNVDGHRFLAELHAANDGLGQH